MGERDLATGIRPLRSVYPGIGAHSSFGLLGKRQISFMMTHFTCGILFEMTQGVRRGFYQCDARVHEALGALSWRPS